jgi:hypothetical protein
LDVAVDYGPWYRERSFRSRPLAAAPSPKPNCVPLAFTVILINALTSLSTNLLKKALDFKVLQIGQISSYLIGYGCVGIPLAAAGYGCASLVTAWVVQSIGNLAIVYARVRHPLAFRLWIPGGGDMLGYGVTVLATNLINWY